jgi:hypothetical protein
MAEFTGTNLVAQWIYSGGTVTLVDATAGSDTNRSYLATIKDATVSINLVAQTGGTALEAALVEGAVGTLIIGPEGTASTKRKYTIPAISQGAKLNFPYDNIVEISCDFQASGAYTIGAY